MENNQKETFPIAQNAESRKVFCSINGNELMEKEFEELGYAIEEILPHGLFLAAGSPKIGKSWLALDMCIAVATGGQLWDFAARQGDVLYLALEDNYRRLQKRIKAVEADRIEISKLHLATASLGINDGLLEQTQNFIADHNNTKLIVIDTLEHIRNSEYDKNMYAYDYRDMTKLREITDKHELTLLLIHHTRKMYDPDPLNTISGSTGLVGAVDGVYVLEKTKRASSKGKLTIANRDTKDFCFIVDFDRDNCRWLLVSKDDEADSEEAICILLDDFIQDSWKGTATELSSELKKLDCDSDLSPTTVTKQIKCNADLLKSRYGISVSFERNYQRRIIMLDRIRSAD